MFVSVVVYMLRLQLVGRGRSPYNTTTFNLTNQKFPNLTSWKRSSMNIYDTLNLTLLPSRYEPNHRWWHHFLYFDHLQWITPSFLKRYWIAFSVTSCRELGTCTRGRHWCVTSQHRSFRMMSMELVWWDPRRISCSPSSTKQTRTFMWRASFPYTVRASFPYTAIFCQLYLFVSSLGWICLCQHAPCANLTELL